MLAAKGCRDPESPLCLWEKLAGRGGRRDGSFILTGDDTTEGRFGFVMEGREQPNEERRCLFTAEGERESSSRGQEGR